MAARSTSLISAGQPGGTPLAGETPPAQADFRRRVNPDAPLLFRSGAEAEFFRSQADEFYLIEVWAAADARLGRLEKRGRPDDPAAP